MARANSTPTPRKSGRPRQTAGRAPRSDGEQTRARILEVAGRTFSKLGYAEATSKQIAAEAGVDLASINYHFGSRAGLYQAVLVEGHRRLISLDVLLQIERDDQPPRDKLERLFAMLIEATKSRKGWHARLFARELLAPTSQLQAAFDAAALPKIAVVAKILSQITGIPAGDPALVRCLISTMAPCLMLLLAGGNFPGPLGKVGAMPAQSLVHHLHAYALGGLDAIAREHAAARAPASGA